VEDSYLSATKAMVYAAIGCLKANQIPAKEHPNLFQTLKTKATNYKRPQ
jgi:hypothetical protein